MIEENKRTLRELLILGEERLREALIEEYKLDARYLLEHITGFDLASFFLHAEEEVEDVKADAFFSLIERRRERVPVAYLTGNRAFMGLDFYVNEKVLIPEQDTELLVEETLTVSAGKRVLDLCTGSGCIAISLMALGEAEEIVATDISKEALLVAEKNLSLLNEEQRKKIKLVQGDLFENIEGKFDIIVSNPPYIETEVINTLQPEVSIFEPRLALDGSKDGLLFYRRIAKESRVYLKEEGKLFLEIGSEQAEAVKNLLTLEGFRNLRVIKDLAGLDRVVAADS